MILQKKLLAFAIFSIQLLCYGQVSDNFNDGNFSANPTWLGDNNLFTVNSSLQLQLNASTDGIACLSVPVSVTSEMQWNCWVKLSFSPSDNNMSRLYLLSDQADLKSNLNGYFIKLGEAGSADAIELVKQSGSTMQTICRGVDGLIASSFSIRLKVIRDLAGNWSVYADTQGGNNFELQASGNDNTFTGGNYSGVYCKYTSSNSQKFYFDDFYSGPFIVDNIAPEITEIQPVASNQVKIVFNEPVDHTSAIQSANYTLSPGGSHPQSVSHQTASPEAVILTFSDSFQSDIDYQLQVANVTDISGNQMLTITKHFSVHVIKPFDVVISEIMADPTPVVGLPDAEYIELFNASHSDIKLENWNLVIGSTYKSIPYLTIPAQGYLILCALADTGVLNKYGTTAGFSSLSITNSGGYIALEDETGNVIHSVNYSDTWYGIDYKADGGWSLEMIDPLNPCGETGNWMASQHIKGGTPGTINSVNAPNPDTKAPELLRVGITDPTHITVWFTETCEINSLQTPANYTIAPEIGNPIEVITVATNHKTANLTLGVPLTENIVYTLQCTTQITDCAGNQINTAAEIRFGIPGSIVSNDIIINELLFDPPNDCVDFIEIYNRSSKILDLRDLIVCNYDTLMHTPLNYFEISTTPYQILPGEYYVLSTDSTAISSYYKTGTNHCFINLADMPDMGSELGNVALTLKNGSLIDHVFYNTSMHYPLLTTTDGVSLERIDPGRPSDDAGNWHSASSTCGYATPGYQNSQFGITKNTQDEIAVSPEVFSPDMDGFDDVLSISCHFIDAGSNASVTIFDASGHQVRMLINRELCGASCVFTWDGINDDNRKATIGRYIILIEVFDLQGNVRKIKKSAVLGGKL